MEKIEWEWITLPVDQIDPDPRNPNRMDEAQLRRLMESLKRPYGQFIPITVRDHPKKPGRYMIVNGEQRWAAHRKLGLKTIECGYGGNISDRLAWEMMVQANELHGRAEPIEMASLVEDLLAMSNEAGDYESFLAAFAYDEDDLEAFKRITSQLSSIEEPIVDLSSLYDDDDEYENLDAPLPKTKKSEIIFRLAFSSRERCEKFVRLMWDHLYTHGYISSPPPTGVVKVPVEMLGDRLLEMLEELGAGD